MGLNINLDCSIKTWRAWLECLNCDLIRNNEALLLFGLACDLLWVDSGGGGGGGGLTCCGVCLCINHHLYGAFETS